MDLLSFVDNAEGYQGLESFEPFKRRDGSIAFLDSSLTERSLYVNDDVLDLYTQAGAQRRPAPSRAGRAAGAERGGVRR